MSESMQAFTNFIPYQCSAIFSNLCNNQKLHVIEHDGFSILLTGGEINELLSSICGVVRVIGHQQVFQPLLPRNYFTYFFKFEIQLPYIEVYKYCSLHLCLIVYVAPKVFGALNIWTPDVKLIHGFSQKRENLHFTSYMSKAVVIAIFFRFWILKDLDISNIWTSQKSKPEHGFSLNLYRGIIQLF